LGRRHGNDDAARRITAINGLERVIASCLCYPPWVITIKITQAAWQFPGFCPKNANIGLQVELESDYNLALLVS